MKKRILILMLSLLLTTGCTCEYNLTIDGNTFTEKVTLTGQTSEEISGFKNSWQIPVDKDEYNTLSGYDSEYTVKSDIYEYNLSGNKLIFNHNFKKSDYKNSTAVSNCYNKLTVSNYNDTIIISTSSKNNCFDKYPPLNSIKVSITVDRKVVSNNADRVTGNTYTWNITKDNADDKSINLTLDNSSSEAETKEEIPNEKKERKFDINNYILYIFLIILVVITYFGYKWFTKFKEKNNNIDEDE